MFKLNESFIIKFNPKKIELAVKTQDKEANLSFSHDENSSASGSASASAPSSALSFNANLQAKVNSVLMAFKKECEEAAVSQQEDIYIDLRLGWDQGFAVEVIKECISQLVAPRNNQGVNRYPVKKLTIAFANNPLAGGVKAKSHQEIMGFVCNAILENRSLGYLKLGWTLEHPLCVGRDQALKIEENINTRNVYSGLAKIIEQHPSLSIMDLSNAFLSNEDIILIAKKLEGNTSLASLKLEFEALDKEGAEALGIALSRNKHLISLSLKSRNSTAEMLAADSEVDSYSQEDTQMRDVQEGRPIEEMRNNLIRILAEVLKINRTLEKLSLDGLGMIEDAVFANFLISLCPNVSLTSLTANLWLVNPRQTEKTIQTEKAIEKLLLENRKLQIINMQQCFSNVKGILNALGSNPTLTNVSLKTRGIFPADLACLGSLLQQNFSLTSLDILCMGYGNFPVGRTLEAGVLIPLANALRQNRSLTSLGIRYNDIHGAPAPVQESDIEYLAQALKINRTLTDLQMRQRRPLNLPANVWLTPLPILKGNTMAPFPFMERNQASKKMSNILYLLMFANRVIKGEREKNAVAEGFWPFISVIAGLIPADFPTHLKRKNISQYRPKNPEAAELERRQQIYLLGPFRVNESLQRSRDLVAEKAQSAYGESQAEKKHFAECQQQWELEVLNRLGLEAEQRNKFQLAEEYYEKAGAGGHAGAAENLRLLPKVERLKGFGLSKPTPPLLFRRVQTHPQPMEGVVYNQTTIVAGNPVNGGADAIARNNSVLSAAQGALAAIMSNAATANGSLAAAAPYSGGANTKTNLKRKL